jgi:O-antigen ligase
MNKILQLEPKYFFGNMILALAFFLPFNNNSISVTLIAAAIVGWMMLPDFFQRLKKSFQSPFFWLFASSWLLELIGLITSHHAATSVYKIQSKLPFFILPLLLSDKAILSKQKKQILIAFVLGCTLAGFTCLVHAFYTYFFLHTNTFFYIVFSMFMHTGFFSMYITFCWAMIAYHTFIYPESEKKIRNASIAIMLFLTIILYLLAAKTSYIVLPLLAILIAAQIIFKKKNLKPYLIFLFLSSFCVFILFYFFTNSVQDRVNNAVQSMTQKDISGNSTESTQLRYMILKTATPLFLENPLIGYSNSNVQDHLDSAYLKNKFIGPYKLHLNAMNQFLQSGLASGITGILFLIAILLCGFFIRNKQYKNFYNYLSIILFINFMTDTIIEWQMGILFFALFIPLLFFTEPTDEKQSA